MQKRMVIFIIFTFFVISGSSLKAETWYEEDAPEDIESLKREISILNLVNALELDKGQIKKIILSATKAQKEQVSFSEEIRVINKEYSEALAELKGVLSEGVEIPAALEEKIDYIKKQRHIAIAQYYQKIKTYQDGIKERLKDEQLVIIEDFQPCVIPPKDLAHPIRAGQSGSNISEIEKLIGDLRDLPDNIFDYFCNKVIDHTITETELAFGKLDPEKRKQEKQRLVNIVKSAREMSDLDFTVEKQRLAKQFISRSDNVIAKFKDLSDFEEDMHGGISKIGKFLLDPAIVPLLKPRLDASFQVKQNAIRAKNQIATEVNEGKKKVSFDELAQLLELTSQQESLVAKYLFEGQKKLWEILQIPRKDNKDIIKEIQEVKENQSRGVPKKDNSMIKILSLRVPRKKVTYFEAMVEIQEKMEANLKIILKDNQFILYKQSGISLFDVKLPAP